MNRFTVSILTLLFLLGCERENPEKAFQNILDDAWYFRIGENPLFATNVGVHTANNRLPSNSQADIDRRAQFWKMILERLDDLDLNSMGEEEQINYRIFRRIVEDRIQDFKFKGYLMPLNADSGFHIGLARLPRRVPLQTVEDYENYIARLEAIPSYMDDHIALMREGIATGMTVPQVVLNDYDVSIQTHIVEDSEESVFYGPFHDIPASVPAGERDRLKRAGRTAVLNSAVEGYRRFLSFFQDEYFPNARQTIGASEYPNGNDYYQYRVNHFTTLKLTPEEIHNIGLGEVERIKKEMMAVIAEVGFDGSFEEFLNFLRTDRQFYAETPEDLLKEASFIAKKMDAQLPSLFNNLPRLPYGVQAVPDHIAPKYTAGRYVGPAKGSREPGYYWVNTYALNIRPLYNLEALSLHEAVPGHHLQNAIARELENLPKFRQHLYLSAFGEGWGLYSEWLGLEAGFYTDAYSNFGRLTYEMWRACRLVVDTGIHAFGWTRKEVIDYMASRTALPIHEVTTETDRYISWPGQALAYKMGELKIKELRQYAEKVLQENFDVREFHDVVLGNGSVPLDVLEDQVKSWVERARSR
ncbi:MAG: DUF885 domain-containing protein [Candidatus Marinimicrobia bacterium]|nr:DUF885 domain-containing protein [Candidatus Neomarinimicrobiota bacterium]|tara:strand:- start:3256 stop:5007 length:1752 start_codon:yes stop_codon:yes gene_type:complete